MKTLKELQDAHLPRCNWREFLVFEGKPLSGEHIAASMHILIILLLQDLASNAAHNRESKIFWKLFLARGCSNGELLTVKDFVLQKIVVGLLVLCIMISALF